MMIRLPIIQRLAISDYGLFPGKPEGSGLDHHFLDGLSLIVGINGLGKTTILTSIMRVLTGPYDITGQGAPDSLGVSLPDNAVKLSRKSQAFFAQRVADDASSAHVILIAKFGEKVLRVVRKLNDLALVECEIDDIELQIEGSRDKQEESYQETLCKLMGLDTFIDVLLVLHYIVFFHEDRLGALWDENAQRQLLRALFLENQDATRLAQLERNVQSADSQARNIKTRITATEKDLRDARKNEAGMEGLNAELRSEQALLDAEKAEKSKLDEDLIELNEKRHKLRLEHERAKIEHEEASSAIERQKYMALANLYPKMDEAMRLVMTRIISHGKCLVCNSEAERKSKELQVLIDNGFCPACGAKHESEESIVSEHNFEKSKLEKAYKLAQQARSEVDAKSKSLQDNSKIYTQTLNRSDELRISISDRHAKEQRLLARMPRNGEIEQLEQALAALENQRRDWQTKLDENLRELNAFLADKEHLVTSRSKELIDCFAQLASSLLEEEAVLAPISAKPRYTQSNGRSGERTSVPAYKVEMAAANRAGTIPRDDSSDVSESQRELIDLAFRLSLIQVATRNAPCTFIMETPEASLDGVAMDRVGEALSQFANTHSNRLIVTNNLSNTGLITALFQHTKKYETDENEQEKRLINLLEIAAPNRALEMHREKYEKLLYTALYGDPK